MDNFIEKNLISLLSQTINCSESDLALESLNAAKQLANYYPLEELDQALNAALKHKSKDVAYLALDVLRLKCEPDIKLKSITPGEYKKIINDAVLPYIVIALRSVSDNIVINALNLLNVLSKDNEFKEVLFPHIEKMMIHKNKQIAHLALDIIREMNIKKEIHIFESL